jgi:hypothetical protein
MHDSCVKSCLDAAIAFEDDDVLMVECANAMSLLGKRLIDARDTLKTYMEKNPTELTCALDMNRHTVKYDETLKVTIGDAAKVFEGSKDFAPPKLLSSSKYGFRQGLLHIHGVGCGGLFSQTSGEVVVLLLDLAACSEMGCAITETTSMLNEASPELVRDLLAKHVTVLHIQDCL